MHALYNKNIAAIFLTCYIIYNDIAINWTDLKEGILWEYRHMPREQVTKGFPNKVQLVEVTLARP